MPSDPLPKWLQLAPTIACTAIAVSTSLRLVGTIAVTGWAAKQAVDLTTNLAAGFIPVGWSGCCRYLVG